MHFIFKNSDLGLLLIELKTRAWNHDWKKLNFVELYKKAYPTVKKQKW